MKIHLAEGPLPPLPTFWLGQMMVIYLAIVELIFTLNYFHAQYVLCIFSKPHNKFLIIFFGKRVIKCQMPILYNG